MRAEKLAALRNYPEQLPDADPETVKMSPEEERDAVIWAADQIRIAAMQAVFASDIPPSKFPVTDPELSESDLDQLISESFSYSQEML